MVSANSSHNGCGPWLVKVEYLFARYSQEVYLAALDGLGADVQTVKVHLLWFWVGPAGGRMLFEFTRNLKGRRAMSGGRPGLKIACFRKCLSAPVWTCIGEKEGESKLLW